VRPGLPRAGPGRHEQRGPGRRRRRSGRGRPRTGRYRQGRRGPTAWVGGAGRPPGVFSPPPPPWAPSPPSPPPPRRPEPSAGRAATRDFFLFAFGMVHRPSFGIRASAAGSPWWPAQIAAIWTKDGGWATLPLSGVILLLSGEFLHGPQRVAVEAWRDQPGG